MDVQSEIKSADEVVSVLPEARVGEYVLKDSCCDFVGL